MPSHGGVEGKAGLGDTEKVTGAGMWGTVGWRECDCQRGSGSNPEGRRGHLAPRIVGGMRIPGSWPYGVGMVAAFRQARTAKWT